MPFTIPFADRLNNVETSAIRELFKLLGRPGIISFAGGFPDSALFDVDGIREAVNTALTEEPGAALQYGATEGHQPLREQIAGFMASKGVSGVAANDLIVTTGSQQGLDLLGKTGPTFLATIQCFRLYGAELITVPVDGEGTQTDQLEQLIAEHKPKFVYLIPTFGNPSGALMSLERRRAVLEMAVKHNTLIVEDDPYGDLYFGEAPPPSLLALSADVPGSRERLVHCGSLSKVLSPGLRVGWMVGPAELLAKATMCKQFSDAHTSTCRPRWPRCGRCTPSAPLPWATRSGVNSVTPSSSCSRKAVCSSGLGSPARAGRWPMAPSWPNARSTKVWRLCRAHRSTPATPTRPRCA